MRRATKRFLVASMLTIALVFATVPAFAGVTQSDSDENTKISKQDVSQTTAPAIVGHVIATDTRFIGYATRCTASVERLDVNWGTVHLPDAPVSEIGHVPLGNW